VLFELLCISVCFLLLLIFREPLLQQNVGVLKQVSQPMVGKNSGTKEVYTTSKHPRTLEHKSMLCLIALIRCQKLLSILLVNPEIFRCPPPSKVSTFCVRGLSDHVNYSPSSTRSYLQLLMSPSRNI
jgi:hypothetical protein